MASAQAVSSHDLQALYSDHVGWLQSFLRRRTGCSQQAADLAQDTFVRVLASKQAVAELRSPRDYLGRIAHGLTVDFYRRRALEQAYLEALAARPEATELSTEERVVLLETLQSIDAMLNALPERTRQIFLMAQFEGLTYPAIGARLGVSVTTVKKHLVRALTQCLVIAEG